MRLLRPLLSSILLAISVASASGQQLGWQTLGSARSVKRIDSGVELVCARGRVRVVALDDSVVRVRATRAAAFPAEHSWAVVNTAAKHVQLVDYRESPADVSFATNAVRVRVSKATLAITFLAPDGRTTAADDPAHPMLWNGTAFQVWKRMPAG